jgi:hypothetical protein
VPVIYLSLGLLKGRPSYLQEKPSAHSASKDEFYELFSTFLAIFALVDPIRIRIHNTVGKKIL